MKRLTQEALDRWGFAKQPFDKRIGGYGELFKPAGGEHDRLINFLLGTIAAVSSVAVVAPVGWGKSLCWAAARHQIAADTKMGYLITEVACLDKDEITARSIVSAMLTDLDQQPGETLAFESLTRRAVAVVKERASKRKRIVVVIDDAQWLRQPAFRTIKGLLDLSDGFNNLVSVILLGQEELGTTLARSVNRQIAARMEIVKPDPFRISDGEVRQYIRHRIFCARHPRAPIDFAEAEADPCPFSDDGLRAVEVECTYSGDRMPDPDGVSADVQIRPDPMVINAICAHSLVTAHEAGESIVTEDLVHNARSKMLAGV